MKRLAPTNTGGAGYATRRVEFCLNFDEAVTRAVVGCAGTVFGFNGRAEVRVANIIRDFNILKELVNI